MFDPEEHDELKKEIANRMRLDRKYLDELIESTRKYGLRSYTKKIKKYHATALSIMASDGGNHKFHFDPFHHQLIRVVDNTGQILARKSIALTTDLDELFNSEFNDPGTYQVPKSSMGRLIKSLSDVRGNQIRSLHELSHMLPKADDSNDPEKSAWVLTYRDLWEWAVLYDQIACRNFASDTIIVREGLLRTKIFGDTNFMILGNLIAEHIKRAKREQHKDIFLVGVAKSSSVIDRYRLAFMVEEVFPSGSEYYVRIPRDMEKEAYKWPEFARGRECIGKPGEEPKFVFGSMHLVRFSPHKGSPIRAVDIFDDQVGDADKIIGYLANDAFDSFPISDFPMSIQRAHEAAKLNDFDADFLNMSLMSAVETVLRETYGEKAREVINLIKLLGDPDSSRY